MTYVKKRKEPKIVAYAKPHITRWRRHYSFSSHRHGIFKPFNQESPDQSLLGSPPDRSLAFHEKKLAFSKFYLVYMHSGIPYITS